MGHTSFTERNAAQSQFETAQSNSSDRAKSDGKASSALELSSSVEWILSGRLTDRDPVTDYVIHEFPFRVGRRRELGLVLNSPCISKLHAEFIAIGDALFLRDLDSTNGTYLNGKAVTEDVMLSSGDLVQFAGFLFRVGSREQVAEHKTIEEMDAVYQGASLSRIDQLIETEAIKPHFQSIVDIRSGNIHGYEILARGNIDGLRSPAEMFLAAELMNLDARLSDVCRKVGIAEAMSLPKQLPIFVNTHPSESLIDDVLPSLVALKLAYPRLKLVVEVHEKALTNPADISYFRKATSELGFQLAYDDFGAGQSRLTELIRVPPDFLKFDIGLIRDIHLTTPQQRRILRSLVKTVRQTGAIPLAEGIEVEEEAETCRELGFQLAQGYLYGKPSTVETLNRRQDPLATTMQIL